MAGKKEILALLVVIGMAGSCGGGGGTTGVGVSDVTVGGNGVVDAVSSGVNAATDTIVQSADTSALALHGPGNFSDCEKTDNEDGSFSITCHCMTVGEQQGTVVHTFDKGVTHDSCARENGMEGPTLSLNGSMTTTFVDCAIEKCDQVVTLSGEITGTVEFFVNTCEHPPPSMNITLGTSDACSGLTATLEDESMLDIGLQVSVSKTGGPQTVSGSLCIDGVTTEFDSLHDLKKALDPEGACEAGDGEDGAEGDDEPEEVEE